MLYLWQDRVLISSIYEIFYVKLAKNSIWLPPVENMCVNNHVFFFISPLKH